MAIDVLRLAQGNNLSDTLSSSIGASDLTIPVNTISIWSSTGGKVIIDRGLSTEEIIYCTGVSGSSLVIQSGGRGLENTTAQGHNVGAVVESVPTAGDWSDLVNAIKNVLLTSTGAVDTTKITDLTTAQTLTNKTLTSPIINKIQGAAAGANFPQVVGEFSNGNSSTAITIDLSKGDRQSVTLTGNCTFTWSNPAQGQSVILRIVEDATGGRTVTLPSGKWPGGTAGTFTTTASAINLLVIYYDGTNYLYQLAAGFA